MPLFAFSGVCLEADGEVILRGVDAEVPAQGVTVIVGRSGAGKSTLLRLCNRLAVPTAGKVCFRGEDVQALDPLVLRRRVGMIFQAPTLFGGTVRDNLLVADPEAGEEDCARALRRAGLDPAFLDRDAGELSGGEAQRACLARTLITEPEVLLLDEPTSALDLENTLVIERLARGLADAGAPVVWVTHDREQMLRIADRVLVVEGGRVSWAGPPEEAQAEVAGLLEEEEAPVEG